MTLPTQGVTTTFECNWQADVVRSYCESQFPVGPSSDRMRSVTGETFTQLGLPWLEAVDTVDHAAEAAIAAFKKYAEDKSGTLYWRVQPEIASKDGKFSYYMRLLISDKPHAKVST